MSRIKEVLRAEAYLKLHKEGKLNQKEDIVRALGLKWFRLCALYFIKDKRGKKVRFKPNQAQREYYIGGHNNDIILKARQLGFTTFKMVSGLDSCCFYTNFSAGCIAHELKAAKDIYNNKIVFAYENIEDGWKSIFKLIGLEFPTPVSDTDMGYKFSNGSSIQVSTSYRGGTLQDLHVSEFGKICRKYPEKAREIVTGAFEAVGLGSSITIESTAEGREGYFFNYCETARKLLEAGKALTEMDFKFHFFPWWRDPQYQLKTDSVVIYPHQQEYFEKLKLENGILLSNEQKNWYVKKAEKLQDDMMREYPSTPDEAFQQSVEGAYYAKQMRFLRKTNHIGKHIGYNPSLPVITAWDLGMNDSMVIWFAQVVGREIHLIDYLEDSGEGFEYYAQLLQEKGYSYSMHFGPHDLSVRELSAGGKTRQESARQWGLNFEIVPRVSNQQEGINAVRTFLPICHINEDKCARGVDCLDNYRKEWDEKLGCYKNQPRHDWASHGAKALETLARAGVFEQMGVMGMGFGASADPVIAWGAHT